MSEVWVVMLIDNNFDEMLGGVCATEEAALKHGQHIMDYDDSITEFYVQKEEVLEKADL